MIWRLVLASIRQRPARSLLLLFGYALGVGVTIALLSIGGALVTQARDQTLIGGGDLVVLPAGIDLETLKTGAVSSMFFSIEPAPFLYREVLSGPRFEDRVTAAAPWIDDELLYLEIDGDLIPISAGANIPSLAAALGVAPDLVAGDWRDLPIDTRWRAPTDAELYASLDRLHVPEGAAAGDSTWAEWHYFNVLLPDDAGWLYLTYMIAGEVPDGRWGGRLLATLVEPGVGERAFVFEVPADEVVFVAGQPDLSIAGSSVTIGSDGVYHLEALIPSEGSGDPLRVDLSVAAASRRYLPPLDIGGAALTSGYTVPMLDGRSTGQICVGTRCRNLEEAGTYHDHNWGTWSEVTWNWGQATVGEYSVLYGGVAKSGQAEGAHFLYVADSDGFAGVYPIRAIRTQWRDDPLKASTPHSISVIAGSGRDSLALEIDVLHARATALPAGADTSPALFYQMRGRATLSGRLSDTPASGMGLGFFETWAQAPSSTRASAPPPDPSQSR